MGVHVASVAASTSTWCRWLNVPRTVSWPVSRMGTASRSRDAKARDSACPHSMAGSSDPEGIPAPTDLANELGMDREVARHGMDLRR